MQANTIVHHNGNTTISIKVRIWAFLDLFRLPHSIFNYFKSYSNPKTDCTSFLACKNYGIKSSKWLSAKYLAAYSLYKFNPITRFLR